jgi:hypothetical protein
LTVNMHEDRTWEEKAEQHILRSTIHILRTLIHLEHMRSSHASENLLNLSHLSRHWIDCAKINWCSAIGSCLFGHMCDTAKMGFVLHKFPVVVGL